ncbi:hypothetical protein [uncultured Oxalicibacterium sp.]|uniref:helix-turn-helix transcriptional regulator n=1 Tax=uncultured Oxalicibacterium sp. TaxID=1168540 RepID=UPI0025F52889|nr:hypothetical protein [uncultured Oxalicibacterium sp.]
MLASSKPDIPDGFIFLEHLYDAVMAPTGFQSFIEQLCTVLALRAVTMIIRHRDTGEVKALWLTGLEPEAMESYALQYAREDILASHIMQAPIAHFYASNLDVRYPESFSQTQFYTEWLVPQGVAYAAGAIVLQEGSWVTQLIVQRRREQYPFDREEMGFLNRLVPHLQRAIQMRQRMEESQIDRDRLTSGLDALTVPAMLFNEQMHILYGHPQAKAFLETADFVFDGGRLVPPARAGARQLGLQVSTAVSASRSGGEQQLHSILQIPRKDRAPLTLMILPLRPEGASPQHGVAMMLVFDPEARVSLATELVQSLFHLSETEAQLAIALCHGKTLDEFAAERGTSRHTVKSQLKSIYLKTGTSRQTNLVSLLLSSPAFFVAASSRT